MDLNYAGPLMLFLKVNKLILHDQWLVVSADTKPLIQRSQVDGEPTISYPWIFFQLHVGSVPLTPELFKGRMLYFTQMCGFSTHKAILHHRLGVLSFNSILTPSTWR